MTASQSRLELDTKAIMLSWIGFHGRSAGLAESLGIPSVFISGGSGNLLERYCHQWRETRRVLRTLPDLERVVLMMPPYPALLAVALGTKVDIAGDLHTGVFYDPKWRRFLSATARLLRKRGIGIVTNSALAKDLSERGVTALVLHDQITDDYRDDGQGYESTLLSEIGTEWILVPLAYAYDEPLYEILDAARETPEITWVLTGKAPHPYREAAPSNVIFPGFISDRDYRRAVSRSSVVAALTTDENTMQRAGYEAMSAGQALLTTPMRVLRDFFQDSAVYADPTGPSLAAGAREAVRERASLRGRMDALRLVRQSEQAEATSSLREWVGGS